MKITVLVFLLITPFVCSAGEVPKIFLEYGEPYDIFCPPSGKDPAFSELQKDLQKRIPSLQTLWDVKGEKLLGTTVGLVGPGFHRKEESVSLVLCSFMPPMSSPLMIRMKEPWKKTKELNPDFYFLSQAFHEILHRYLDENFGQFLDERKSPLFLKYVHENEGVLVHIHHLSVLKAVYLQLGWKDDLKKIIEMDSEIPGPVYKRSWEIVNAEGYERFLAELKNSKKK